MRLVDKLTLDAKDAGCPTHRFLGKYFANRKVASGKGEGANTLVMKVLAWQLDEVEGTKVKVETSTIQQRLKRTPSKQLFHFRLSRTFETTSRRSRPSHSNRSLTTPRSPTQSALLKKPMLKVTPSKRINSASCGRSWRVYVDSQLDLRKISTIESAPIPLAVYT